MDAAEDDNMVLHRIGSLNMMRETSVIGLVNPVIVDRILDILELGSKLDVELISVGCSVSVITEWVIALDGEVGVGGDCSVEKLIVTTEEILIVIDIETEEEVPSVIVLDKVEILDVALVIVEAVASSEETRVIAVVE